MVGQLSGLHWLRKVSHWDHVTTYPEEEAVLLLVYWRKFIWLRLHLNTLL